MVTRARFIVLLVLVIVGGGIAAYLLMPRPAPAPADEPVAETRPPAPAAPPPVTVAPPEPPAAPPAPGPRAAAPRRPTAPAAPTVDTATPPTTATLRIESDVPGAQVFVDRVFLGAAPATAENLAPGSHQVNVTAPGHEGYAQSVEVVAGQNEVVVRFREVRLDIRTDVVHKHRFGSCRGTLIATADGLRYETTNRDDAFTAPLTALDPLEVDYLEKNLRVRRTGGRQYDFTDPAENADNLFVFQRDVNRARERLVAGDSPAGR